MEWVRRLRRCGWMKKRVGTCIFKQWFTACIAGFAFCSASILLHKLCILSCIAQRDTSDLTTDSVSVVDSSIDGEKTYNTELTALDHTNDNQRENYSEHTQVSILTKTMYVQWSDFIITHVFLADTLSHVLLSLLCFRMKTANSLIQSFHQKTPCSSIHLMWRRRLSHRLCTLRCLWKHTVTKVKGRGIIPRFHLPYL